MTANAKSGPPRDREGPPAPPPPPAWRRWLIPIGLLATMLLLFLPGSFAKQPTAVDYGTLSQQVDQGKVESLTLAANGTITGTYRSSFDHGADFTSHYPTGI